MQDEIWKIFLFITILISFQIIGQKLLFFYQMILLKIFWKSKKILNLIIFLDLKQIPDYAHIYLSDIQTK